jgi:hypothetical protein
LQLYEVAWSTGKVEVLDDVVAEQHRQRDLLHPAASSEGRERIKQGISRFRALVSIEFSILNICSDPDAQVCFVEWSAMYHKAAEGEEVAEDGSVVGVSVLSFEQGMIAETRVYRQST